MDLFQSIILGLVQGITEFLPISSSGHLVLVRGFLDIETAQALAFDAVLHFATASAVLLYFWRDVWTLLQAFIRKLGRLPVNEKDITLFYALVVGTVPAVVLGFFLEEIIEAYLQQPIIVAVVLALGAFFFMYAEWRYFLSPQHTQISVHTGLLIGFFQSLALIPGFSRSGATLAGGMLIGLSRYESARFSFLLAIPITFGVGIKKILDLMQIGGVLDWMVIVAGAVTAFVLALVVIHFFLAFIRRYTLWPFIWYSLVISVLVFYSVYFV